MQEKLVEFNTAKLAKEKGFEEVTNWAYKVDGTKISFKGQGGINANLNHLVGLKYNLLFRQNTKNVLTSAPTQSLLQKWLREVHNIDVEARPVRFVGDEKTSYYQTYINGSVFNNKKRFDIYEDAMEDGLQEALKLIRTTLNNQNNL